MDTTTKIKELFESIQGEGPYLGYKQLFIRFCGCNLSCNYCDTDYDASNAIQYSADNLIKVISNNYNLNTIHSLSLTGGEPLLHSVFLSKFLPQFKNLYPQKIYLETNATLVSEFLFIKKYIDIISADIKLPSSSGKDIFNQHEKFLQAAKGVNTFAKIVFDMNITDSEIETCIKLAQIDNIELILQPKMNGSNISVDSDFTMKILNKFLKKYKNVRTIAQTHKFLSFR